MACIIVIVNQIKGRINLNSLYYLTTSTVSWTRCCYYCQVLFKLEFLWIVLCTYIKWYFIYSFIPFVTFRHYGVCQLCKTGLKMFGTLSWTVTQWITPLNRFRLKALANEDTLFRTHCCSWCFLGCANWETFVADTKYFWTKSETFFVSQTQNLCPLQMLRARANGETFVSATMCPRLPGPINYFV